MMTDSEIKKMIARLPEMEAAITARITVQPVDGKENHFVATADFSDLFDGDSTKVIRKAAGGDKMAETFVGQSLRDAITDVFIGFANCPANAGWINDLPDLLVPQHSAGVTA